MADVLFVNGALIGILFGLVVGGTRWVLDTRSQSATTIISDILIVAVVAYWYWYSNSRILPELPVLEIGRSIVDTIAVFFTFTGFLIVLFVLSQYDGPDTNIRIRRSAHPGPPFDINVGNRTRLLVGVLTSFVLASVFIWPLSVTLGSANQASSTTGTVFLSAFFAFTVLYSQFYFHIIQSYIRLKLQSVENREISEYSDFAIISVEMALIAPIVGILAGTAVIRFPDLREPILLALVLVTLLSLVMEYMEANNNDDTPPTQTSLEPSESIEASPEQTEADTNPHLEDTLESEVTVEDITSRRPDDENDRI